MARPVPSITKKDISSLRSTLEYFREAGELLASDAEIDPHLELAAIQKRLDGGPPMLFEHVKGYPNARLANNLYASADRIARLFGAEAEVLWRLRIAGEGPTHGAFIAPEIPPDLPRIW